MNSFTNKLLIGQTILIAILGIAIYFVWHQNNNNKQDLDAFKTAMSDKFTTFTNKNGQQVAQVQAAVFATTGNFQSAVKQLNAAGANIQSKIDNATQGLILLDKKIGGELSGTTKIIGEDTIKKTVETKGGKDSTTLTVLPEYKIDTLTKWYSLNGTVGPKKYVITPMFFDSTELKPTMLKGGFLKPSILGVQSLNKNPYANTTGLKYLSIKKTPAPVWKVLGIVGLLGAGIYLGHTF